MTTILRDLNLEVKVFAQPLGAENNWSDLGDGLIEIRDSLVRVKRLPQSPHDSEEAEADPELLNKRLADALKDGNAEDDAEDDDPILLEDTLTPDTHLMGRDTCIVWNSPDQELSFCVMFAADLGYQAALRAFQFLTQSTFDDAWDADLIAPLMSSTKSPAEFGELLATELEEVIEHGGFIERHAVAMAFVAGDFASVPGVVSNRRCCHALLLMQHPAIIEYMLNDRHFAAFAAGCSDDNASPAASPTHAPAAGSTAQLLNADWTVPASLQSLPLMDDIKTTLTRVTRLHAMRPTGGPAEAHPIAELINTVTQRQINQLIIRLTTDETFLNAFAGSFAACAGIPAVTAETSTPVTLAASTKHAQPMSPAALGSSSSGTGGAASPNPDAMEEHLLCLKDLLEMTVALHSRDMCSTEVARVFKEAKGLYCIAAVSQWLVNNPQHTKHEAVTRALYKCYDFTLVLLNQKGDEGALAELFRDPIVASVGTGNSKTDPLGAILAFLCSKLPSTAVAHNAAAKQSPKPLLATLASAVPSKGVPVTSNTSCAIGATYLWHLLGMHDDEGTTVDRDANLAACESRNAIQNLFVTRGAYYMLLACDKVGQLPESVSSLFEYLLRLCASKQRDDLVQMLLSSTSPLIRLVIAHDGGMTKAEFLSNMRLCKSIIFALSCLERKITTPLIHRITFSRDVIGTFLSRLKLDRRGLSMSHSVFYSLLSAITLPGGMGLPAAVDPLEPLRRFVMLKHRATLPARWVALVDAAELEALANECTDDGFRSPIPFVSPSRAPTPANSSNGGRPKRMAEEVLPPDEKHNQMSSKLRALVAAKQADAVHEADRSMPALQPVVGNENVNPSPPQNSDPPLKRRPMAPSVKPSTAGGRNKRSTSGGRPGSSEKPIRS